MRVTTRTLKSSGLVFLIGICLILAAVSMGLNIRNEPNIESKQVFMFAYGKVILTIIGLLGALISLFSILEPVRKSILARRRTEQVLNEISGGKEQARRTRFAAYRKAGEGSTGAPSSATTSRERSSKSCCPAWARRHYPRRYRAGC